MKKTGGAMSVRRVMLSGLVVAFLAIGGALLWHRHTPGVGPRNAVGPDQAVPPDAATDVAPPALAAWMRAPPSPLVVDAPVLSPRRVQDRASAGGRILELVANRRKFTLYVPPGAIAMDAEIAMTAITRIPGLPFADQEILAVRIENLPRPLLKPVTLTIEPQRQAQAAPPVVAAAFAIDGASDGAARELHLYPFVHSAENVRNFRQHRYQMLLGEDGVYGIANVTDAELAAANARIPTDFLSRLEMMIAQALREPPTPATAGHWNRWSPIATAHAQGADGQQHLTELERGVAQALRDYYDQKLMPRLDKLGRGCSEEDRQFFMAFNDEARRWLKAAQLIGFIRMGPDQAPLDPTTNPYEYHAEAARRAYYRQLEKEFAARADALDRGLLSGTKRMFEAVKACCRKQPERWMPPYLASMQREAEIGGYAVAANGLGDSQTCACAVDAVHEGKGWTGSITQTDSYSGKARSATSRRRTETTSTHRYTVSVTMLGGDADGSALGLATSSGENETTTRRVDSAWACAVDEGGISREVTGAQGTQLGPVDISLMPDGRYTINFPHPLATGLEHSRDYLKRNGCRNRFNDGTTDNHSMRSGSVAPDYHKTIHGRTDVATVLEGSISATTPDSHLKRNREATVQWNVRACAAK